MNQARIPRTFTDYKLLVLIPCNPRNPRLKSKVYFFLAGRQMDNALSTFTSSRLMGLSFLMALMKGT